MTTRRFNEIMAKWPENRWPKPIARVLEWEEIDEHRKEDCAERQRCGQLAANQRWVGYSCKGCPRYEKVMSDIQTPQRYDWAMPSMSTERP